MKPRSRFPDDEAGRRPARGAAKPARPKPASRRAAPKRAAAPVPPGMIRLRNGRVVRAGEVVVFVRLRSGGPGVYILSEDIVCLPPDLDIGAIEVDRGISLDSPLVLHPEVEG